MSCPTGPVVRERRAAPRRPAEDVVGLCSRAGALSRAIRAGGLKKKSPGFCRRFGRDKEVIEVGAWRRHCQGLWSRAAGIAERL